MRLPVRLPCRVFRSEAQASRTLPSPFQASAAPSSSSGMPSAVPAFSCSNSNRQKMYQASPSLLSLSPDLHRFARSELVRNVSGLFEEVLTLNHPSKVICEFWKLLLLVSVRCEKSLWP